MTCRTYISISRCCFSLLRKQQKHLSKNSLSHLQRSIPHSLHLSSQLFTTHHSPFTLHHTPLSISPPNCSPPHHPLHSPFTLQNNHAPPLPTSVGRTLGPGRYGWVKEVWIVRGTVGWSVREVMGSVR